jgi:hypothetical protein
MRPTALVSIMVALALTACGREDDVDGYDALARHVERNRVGEDADQWIEMLNLGGEWERTALIFGYVGDHGECEKVVAGLKDANPAREYRCTRAN